MRIRALTLIVFSLSRGVCACRMSREQAEEERRRQEEEERKREQRLKEEKEKERRLKEDYQRKMEEFKIKKAEEDAKRRGCFTVSPSCFTVATPHPHFLFVGLLYLPILQVVAFCCFEYQQETCAS